tara:strand:- start:49 stop:285 length:237 start_codon:yes stop_codon:yes gene_type:complete
MESGIQTLHRVGIPLISLPRFQQDRCLEVVGNLISLPGVVVMANIPRILMEMGFLVPALLIQPLTNLTLGLLEKSAYK